MKILKKIFKGEQAIEDNVNIYYDDVITKGLRSVMLDNHVKQNEKTLEITRQTKDLLKESPIHVQYNYNNKFVVISFLVRSPQNTIERFQFIVEDTLTVENLFKCKHYVLTGMREVIANAIKLLTLNNVGDLPEWFDDVQKMSKSVDY